MPPIEHAIIGTALCWRYVNGNGKWRVCSPPELTTEIKGLRAQLGLAPYQVIEDAESIAPWASESSPRKFPSHPNPGDE